jgi:hypothetical protein
MEVSSCDCRTERSQCFPRLETNIPCDDIIGRDASTRFLNSRLAIRICHQIKKRSGFRAPPEDGKLAASLIGKRVVGF